MGIDVLKHHVHHVMYDVDVWNIKIWCLMLMLMFDFQKNDVWCDVDVWVLKKWCLWCFNFLRVMSVMFHQITIIDGPSKMMYDGTSPIHHFSFFCHLHRDLCAKCNTVKLNNCTWHSERTQIMNLNLVLDPVRKHYLQRKMDWPDIFTTVETS